ncbi:hypothetical protein DFJ58DRAFT_723185 [Suillus subalutaceus]|uniref:uncharacterized protein n=1 Tax=Suillus subalutaceus TaxID=48586 RepID=UPI001B8693A0|nr:uncharacterized protein DFJ58DRAFT_723185 [Suillus subalutaceus]KAG1869338.1 hypothetical protein DFJ58DRAFT_723185 [Suillus subalutaceus]
MSPVWLYVPTMGDILQLHEEHPFTAITTGLYVVVGYLANHHQVSPIYCEQSFQEAQPWTGWLTQLGWLIIPSERDITHLHKLFTATPTDGTHISAITPTCCRADARGIHLPTWLLQELLDASIQFFYAPFPDGYPPPAAAPAQKFMYEAPPSAHSSTLDNALSDVLLFDLTATELQEIDCGYNYWGLSTIGSLNGIDNPAGPLLDDVDEDFPEELALQVFHPDLQWRRSKGCMWETLNKKQRGTLTCAMKKSSWWRIVMLTRAMFIGGLWVGERQNSFRISQTEVRRMVTNDFLTTLCLVHKTYEEMLDQPVNAKLTNGITISAGWLEFHMNIHLLLLSLSPY